MKALYASAAAVVQLVSTTAFAQVPGGGVGQSGAVSANNAVCWQANGLVKDCGSAPVTTPVSPANGGTGVNNGTNTLTWGGTTVFSGAFAVTITSTATSNATLPAGTHSLAPLDSPSFTTPTLGVATGTSLALSGSSSGTTTLKAAATASGTITWPAGTTDFSATGGTSQVVKQTSSGGALTVAQLANTDITGLGGYAAISAGVITSSLGSDINLNNTNSYFDGPSVAQGSTGTWCASGTVTVYDTATQATFATKLWDGTTVIASTEVQIVTVTEGKDQAIALSGCLASPAGNIRISVRDTVGTTGVMAHNDSGNSKDSTVTVWRVN